MLLAVTAMGCCIDYCIIHAIVRPYFMTNMYTWLNHTAMSLLLSNVDLILSTHLLASICMIILSTTRAAYG